MGKVFSSLADEEFNRLFLDFRYTAYRLETLQRYDVSYERFRSHTMNSSRTWISALGRKN